MARKARRGSRTDTTNLEQHGGLWRVNVAVPKAAQPEIGKTRLKHPLGTDSLALANKLKKPFVDAFKEQIRVALEGTTGDPLTREALRLAALRAGLQHDDDRDNHDDAIRERADEIRGDPTGMSPRGREYLYDPTKERKATDFYFLATGARTPLKAHHDSYLKQQAHLRAHPQSLDS